MTTRLLINADDMGLTPGVNRAIVELFRAGALSSATLMANGAAFDDAVALAKANPRLGVGCHIVLTDGVPVAPPSSIPSLLEPQSATINPRLRSSLRSFAQAALLERIRDADIEREASAQINRLLAAGIRPTHLDTHKHTHLFPSVLRPLLRVAARFGIPALRNPFEPPWNLRLRQGSNLRRLQMHLLARMRRSFEQQLAEAPGQLRTTDGTVGVSATGDLQPASLAALLDALPSSGTWEFVCHPGYNDSDLDRITTRLRGHREIERGSLLSLVPAALAANPLLELVSFAALAPSVPASASRLQEARSSSPAPTLQ